MKSLKIILAIGLISATILSYANGFQVLLQGNRQVGMGNIGVALRPDASSIFWNPGSMALVKESSIMVGASLIWSKVVYHASDLPNSTHTSHTDNPVKPPFHAFGVWKPAGKNFSIGMGIYTPYGSTVKWEDNWRGDLILQKITLQAFFFQPTFSYSILDNLSIGAGFVYARGNVLLNRNLPIYTDEGQSYVELEGGGNGYGFNIGAYYEPVRQLSIGFNYRSKVNMKVKDGDANFFTPEILNTNFPPGNKFSAKLPLPANIALGVTYRPNDSWAIGVEAVQTRWGAYKALSFDFEQETNAVQDSRSPRNWQHSWQVKIGAEYKPLKQLALRAGFYFDQSPTLVGYLTPESPNADRLNYTVGIGYNIKNMVQIDASFLFVTSKKTEQTLQDLIDAGTFNEALQQQDALPGTYDYQAFIPGISITYLIKRRANE